MRPIQEFNIAKPNSKELEQTLNQTNTAKRIKFNTVSSLTSKSNSKTKKKESFDLIESSVWIENLDELENLDLDLIGPRLERNKIFPEFANIEFACVLEDQTIRNKNGKQC